MEITEIHLNALTEMTRNTLKASELSDGELIDEVAINCGFDVCSYPEALIDELSQRFQKVIRLERTPKGISIVEK